MAKDFSDFLEYVKTLDNQEIQDSIIKELNDCAEQNDIPEDMFFIWHMRSFSHRLMLKYLEEYHKWLHD